MSRYFPPPPGYRPGRILDLREKREGGGLLPRVRDRPDPAPYAGRNLVVLVHGFNNHYGEAGAAYHGFRLRSYFNTAGMAPPALERFLGDVMWPGDADGWGIADRADFLVYPVAVGTAREAGPKLAAHLRAMPNLLTVHFCGHSLGCRVVLETLKSLRGEGGPVVGRVCLMAAAVPRYHLRRPRGHLVRAMRTAERILVLYSRSDRVLKYAFPAGQTFARGREGFFPGALGSRKPPHDIAGNVHSVRISDAGHGDYWGHSGSRASRVASRRAAAFLRLGAMSRTIERRAGPERRSIG